MPCCPMIYSSGQAILTGKPWGEPTENGNEKSFFYPNLFLSLFCGGLILSCQLSDSEYFIPYLLELLGQFHSNVSVLTVEINSKTTNEIMMTDSGANNNQKTMKWQYLGLLRQHIFLCETPPVSDQCPAFFFKRTMLKFLSVSHFSCTVHHSLQQMRACWGYASCVLHHWGSDGMFSKWTSLSPSPPNQSFKAQVIPSFFEGKKQKQWKLFIWQKKH